ncbi:MAG: hypothetical protein GY953_47195, partial [bacterium]|nr:hypothetical protein [bacterium]
LLFAAAFPGLVVVDTATREVATEVRTSLQRSGHMLVNYTGTRLYGVGFNFVAVIDTASAKELKRIPIPRGEFNHRLNRLALSFDGGSLFVNDQNSPFMTRINTQRLEVAETIPVSDERSDFSSIFMVP